MSKRSFSKVFGNTYNLREAVRLYETGDYTLQDVANIFSLGSSYSVFYQMKKLGVKKGVKSDICMRLQPTYKERLQREREKELIRLFKR